MFGGLEVYASNLQTDFEDLGFRRLGCLGG